MFPRRIAIYCTERRRADSTDASVVALSRVGQEQSPMNGSTAGTRHSNRPGTRERRGARLPDGVVEPRPPDARAGGTTRARGPGLDQRHVPATTPAHAFSAPKCGPTTTCSSARSRSRCRGCSTRRGWCSANANQEQIQFSGQEMILGRDPQADYPLPYPMISWRHARLERTATRNRRRGSGLEERHVRRRGPDQRPGVAEAGQRNRARQLPASACSTRPARSGKRTLHRQRHHFGGPRSSSRSIGAVRIAGCSIPSR